MARVGVPARVALRLRARSDADVGDAGAAAELAQVLVKAAANVAVVRTLVAEALAVVARAKLLPGRAARRDAVVVGVVAEAVAQAAEAATRSRALRGSGEGSSCPISAPAVDRR